MIACLSLINCGDTLQIRKLNKSGSLKDQRFIITLKSDVDTCKFTTRLFAEMMILNNHLRFLVKPEKQFPDIVRLESDLFSRIENIISSFVKDKYKIDIVNTYNKPIAKISRKADVSINNQ